MAEEDLVGLLGGDDAGEVKILQELVAEHVLGIDDGNLDHLEDQGGGQVDVRLGLAQHRLDLGGSEHPSVDQAAEEGVDDEGGTPLLAHGAPVIGDDRGDGAHRLLVRQRMLSIPDESQELVPAAVAPDHEDDGGEAQYQEGPDGEGGDHPPHRAHHRVDLAEPQQAMEAQSARLAGEHREDVRLPVDGEAVLSITVLLALDQGRVPRRHDGPPAEVGDVDGGVYGGPQCLDTNGAFLRFEKDCFRLPETNPLFQNTPYQESILPEKHVA